MNMLKKFNGTIEYIKGQKAAIIELTLDQEWCGGGRIELSGCGCSCCLYEEGYRQLSMSARYKGGRLETYKEIQNV